VISSALVARGSAVVVEDNSGLRSVVFSLLVRGSKIWCRFTGRHMHRYAAFVADSRVLVDPLIEGAICASSTQISGLSAARAREIMVDLNYGPLPVAFRLMS
jgi:preprotein translocase subunit SecD